MRNVVLLMIFVATLSGCGIAAKVQARRAYEQATANYNHCLSKNRSDIRICDADKLIMISDEQEYNSLSAGIESGGIQTLNINSK